MVGGGYQYLCWCRYSCKKGYRMMGTSTVFCTQAGWSVKQAPVCASKKRL